MEMTKELSVRIESAGGALTMTPLSLLNYFLPGARQDLKNPQLYIGRQPGATKDCYVQVEALAGMLLEAKEKHLNPVTQMYLIASSSPEKRATHKIKYNVGLERARKIPGFLGINSGLRVVRALDPIARLKKKVEIRKLCQELHMSEEETGVYLDAVPTTETIDRSGSLLEEGDRILGSWAEAYIVGLTAPIRKEIDEREFWQENSQWDKKGSWMMVKVAEDHLCTHGLASFFAEEQPGQSQPEGSGVLLEAQSQPSMSESMPEGPMPDPSMPESAPPSVSTPVTPEVQPQPFQFQPGTLYVGSLAKTQKRNGKTPGGIIIETEHGPLTVYFWTRPEALKEHEDWAQLTGLTCSISFTEQSDKSGKIYRYVDKFTFAPTSDEYNPMDAPGDAIEPEPVETA